MARPLLCFLLLLALVSLGVTTPAQASANAPMQGTLGQPLQLGPWQVTVYRAWAARRHDTPVLMASVTLRNTTNTPQPLDNARLLTCYRQDVWAAVAFLGSNPPHPSSVAPGQKLQEHLLYQRPEGLLTFGLVFFWQDASTSATGIWLLELRQ